MVVQAERDGGLDSASAHAGGASGIEGSSVRFIEILEAVKEKRHLWCALERRGPKSWV